MKAVHAKIKLAKVERKKILDKIKAGTAKWDDSDD